MKTVILALFIVAVLVEVFGVATRVYLMHKYGPAEAIMRAAKLRPLTKVSFSCAGIGGLLFIAGAVGDYL